MYTAISTSSYLYLFHSICASSTSIYRRPHLCLYLFLLGVGAWKTGPVRRWFLRWATELSEYPFSKWSSPNKFIISWHAVRYQRDKLPWVLHLWAKWLSFRRGSCAHLKKRRFDPYKASTTEINSYEYLWNMMQDQDQCEIKWIWWISDITMKHIS